MATKATMKSPRKSFEQKNLDKSVDFQFYAPNAEEVLLAGQFNDWNPSKGVLRKDAKGNWRTSLKLKPGRYEYRFLVDGNWENDATAAEYIPNAFGTWNCVIEVR